jgi:hypothetical protein
MAENHDSKLSKQKKTTRRKRQVVFTLIILAVGSCELLCTDHREEELDANWLRELNIGERSE